MRGFDNQKKSKKNINNAQEQIISQALSFHSQGKIQEAAKYYQHYIKKGFQNHIVFTNYGIILNDLGKSKEAELLIRKAIELKPNLAALHFNLGNILLNLGKSKEAIWSYQKAIELDPEYALAYSSLGNIFKSLNRTDDAEKLFLRAIELNPNLAEAYNNLGSLLIYQDRFLEAESTLSRAIELNQNLAEAHNNLGIALTQLSKYQEAELSIRKAIEVKPNYVKAYLTLADLMRVQKKSKESELLILKAIELDPKLGESYFQLSILYSKDNDYPKAYKAINLALKYDPGNHQIQGEFTRLKFLMGLYDEENSKLEVPWSNSDDYFYEDNNSDILLISFSSNGRDEKLIPSFNFYQLLKNEKSFDKLFFRDIDRNYYLNGLKNSSENLQETIDLIEKCTSIKNYRKKISIGASAGGFAAILYGQILNFSKVIAFNPQTVISEEKETIVKDMFYTVERCKELRNLHTSDAFYQNCLNLKNLVPFKTKVDLHFSNLSKEDKNHAKFIEHTNCELIKHNSSSHLLALQLRESKKLKEIILDNLME